MKNKKRIAAVAITAICMSVVLMTISQKDSPNGQGNRERTTVEPAKLTVTNSVEPGFSHSTQENESRQIKPQAVESHIEQEREAITEQLGLIAAAYAAEVHYPPYSKPISENNLSYLEPNYYSVVEVPVLDGKQTASLSLPKYRFFYPEPVTVSLNTQLAVDNIKFDFYEPTTGKRLVSKQTEMKTLTVEPDESWPQEVRVKATIDFEQGTDILTADFAFYIPAAYLRSAGAPSSQGADMVIPLYLDVKQAGIYRIRANLLTRDGKVIAALNNKSRLGEGEQAMALKVHSSVLAQTDGHYQLRHWVIEKMSGYPGEKASFGISTQDAIQLAPFDPSTLSQEPYTPSPEEQQRLEFLRQAARQ